MANASTQTTYPHYWDEAKAYLSQQCPIMAQLIARYEGEGLQGRGDSYYTLMRSVAGQQISVKAADAIWGRIEQAVNPLTPANLLRQSDETLRACGLSLQKINYMRNVSEFFAARGIFPADVRGGEAVPHPPTPNGAGPSLSREAGEGTRLSERSELSRRGEGAYWASRSDQQIIDELTAIKGIGSWTAEMFLIFHLARPDIFPVKDIGVLKAIDLHYYPQAKKRKNPAQYQRLAKRWAPYRTVATWYLWRALDPVPVAY